jgi:transposase
MDNLASHSAAALYETFKPSGVKRIWDRLEFVFTPKHGSWLNMAEIELNVLTKQCLNRRIKKINTVKAEVKAWQDHRNNKKAIIKWQFTANQARTKLHRLYRSIHG